MPATTTENCRSARHSNRDEQLEPEGMWALNSTYSGIRAGEGDDTTRAESRQWRTLGNASTEAGGPPGRYEPHLESEVLQAEGEQSPEGEQAVRWP